MTPNQIRCLLIEALMKDYGYIPVYYLKIIKAIDELEGET